MEQYDRREFSILCCTDCSTRKRRRRRKADKYCLLTTLKMLMACDAWFWNTTGPETVKFPARRCWLAIEPRYATVVVVASEVTTSTLFEEVDYHMNLAQYA